MVDTFISSALLPVSVLYYAMLVSIRYFDHGLIEPFRRKRIERKYVLFYLACQFGVLIGIGALRGDPATFVCAIAMSAILLFDAMRKTTHTAQNFQAETGKDMR